MFGCSCYFAMRQFPKSFPSIWTLTWNCLVTGFTKKRFTFCWLDSNARLQVFCLKGRCCWCRDSVFFTQELVQMTFFLYLIGMERLLISSYPEIEGMIMCAWLLSVFCYLYNNLLFTPNIWYFTRTGESRGFAFVRYRDVEEAQKAVDRLDGT